MKHPFFYFFLLFAVLRLHLVAQEIKRDSVFDASWKFFRGKAEGAEKSDFDDKTWRTLDLPHDWSIEDLPGQGITKLPDGKIRIISGPFDSESISSHGSGYTVGGTSWYRKHFKLSEKLADKVISVNFDGVYMKADVWINGHHLGNHPYGYTAFGFDLSQYLNFGDSENILAVEVKNEGVNSRWYSGSGIYRHVYLDITNKIHVAHWGTSVVTTSADSLDATVQVCTTINNYTRQHTDVTLVYKILNANSVKISEKILSTQLSRSVPSTTKLKLDIHKPGLWSTDSPVLYTAVCEIRKDGQVLDKAETKFGIRLFRFDSEKGLSLNGKPIK